MKTLGKAVLLVICWQAFVFSSAAEPQHPTRKDLAIQRRAFHRSRTISQRNSIAPRKMSAVNYSAVSRQPSFVVPSPIFSCDCAISVVSGDFDGNGTKDLAALTVPAGGTYLSVLLGHGDGVFSAPIQTTANGDQRSLLYSVDVNHDGKDDIVIIRSDFVDVYISTGNGQFSAPVTYSDAIADPAAVAITHTDNDSKTSIVVADGISGAVARFLGNDDGSFQPAVVSSVPVQFSFAVFADVNHDGILDLVTGAEVLLGSSNGTFTIKIPFSAGDTRSCSLPQQSIAVGDLNHDGNPDIAIAGCTTDQISIYLGDGNGNFTLASTVWAGFGVESIRIADMNGDHIPDLVAANLHPGDINVLLGDGSANFESAFGGYAIGGTLVQPFVIDDFDGNGHLDVVADSWGYTGQLTMLTGLGDGSLQTATTLYPQPGAANFGDYALSLATADFNGDGRPDFVMGGIFGPSTGGILGGANSGIVTFLADSSGALRQSFVYGTGGALASVAVGDFNHDGKMDIVAADMNSGDISLFLGNGDGSFQDAGIFPAAPEGASAMVVADFNQDGWLDIAIVGWDRWPTSVYILLNDQHGAFQPTVSYPESANAWAIAAGDLNNDGHIDLLVPHFVTNTFSVLLGNGDGTFRVLPDFSNGSNSPGGVVLKDVNGDGNLDLVFTTAQGAAVAFGNGDGTFQPPTFYDASHGSDVSSTGNLRLADMNGDNKLDIVFTNLGFGTVDVMPGNGDGTFGGTLEFSVGGMPYDLLVTDLNYDGAPDIAIADSSYPGITTLTNDKGAYAVVVASPDPAPYGAPIVLQATITRSTPALQSVPSGMVTFMESGNSLGTSPLQGSGSASLVLPTLAPGQHRVSIFYSGDENTFPVSSAAVIVAVDGDAPSYVLTADPMNASIQAGQSASFNITAASLNGFSGTVNFACENLPDGISCNYNPGSVQLSAGELSTVQLTVQFNQGQYAANHSPGTSLRPIWAVTVIGLLGLVLVGPPRTQARRKSLTRMLLAVVLLASMGCGGKMPAPPAQQPRQVLVQVHANAGKISQHLNLTLIVNQ